MKTIIEYLINNHVDNKGIDKFDTDDLYNKPIHYNGIDIMAQNNHTVKNFNNDSEVPFKSLSDFIEEFAALWDELPKDKNKFVTASLFYNGSNAIGFTLYTKENKNRTISWNEYRNTWSISDAWHINTFYYNERKDMFEKNLFE